MKTFGTIVHIDLTTEKTWRESITEEMRRLYVGGRGISARLLYDFVPKGADPLGPDNVVIFAAGALSGCEAFGVAMPMRVQGDFKELPRTGWFTGADAYRTTPDEQFKAETERLKAKA